MKRFVLRLMNIVTMAVVAALVFLCLYFDLMNSYIFHEAEWKEFQCDKI